MVAPCCSQLATEPSSLSQLVGCSYGCSCPVHVPPLAAEAVRQVAWARGRLLHACWVPLVERKAGQSFASLQSTSCCHLLSTGAALLDLRVAGQVKDARSWWLEVDSVVCDPLRGQLHAMEEKGGQRSVGRQRKFGLMAKAFLQLPTLAMPVSMCRTAAAACCKQRLCVTHTRHIPRRRGGETAGCAQELGHSCPWSAARHHTHQLLCVLYHPAVCQLISCCILPHCKHCWLCSCLLLQHSCLHAHRSDCIMTQCHWFEYSMSCMICMVPCWLR